MTNRMRMALLVALLIPAAIAGCLELESGGGTNACAGACGPEEECCGGQCVDVRFDPFHCGTCDRSCTGDARVCTGGMCGNNVNCQAACNNGEACCGDQCCGSGQVCCGVFTADYQCIDINKLACPP